MPRPDLGPIILASLRKHMPWEFLEDLDWDDLTPEEQSGLAEVALDAHRATHAEARERSEVAARLARA